MAPNLPQAAPDDTLRFPIGKFNTSQEITPSDLQSYLTDLASLPAQMREAVQGLNQEQLETPYRPGGWTVRQVVHHVADSHLNSYLRFRLALTEEEPIIKPYEEALWAELPDAKTEPIEVSLILLEALHQRWVILLKALTAEEWQRVYIHPASGKTPLYQAAGLYAWHGRHHLMHILNLRQLNNW